MIRVATKADGHPVSVVVKPFARRGETIVTMRLRETTPGSGVFVSGGFAVTERGVECEMCVERSDR